MVETLVRPVDPAASRGTGAVEQGSSALDRLHRRPVEEGGAARADAAEGHAGLDEPSEFVVVANRLAVQRGDDGTWQRSPGGLVTALAPVMAARDGSWVGWHGSTDEALGPFTHENMLLDPVPLGEEEKRLYYDGFCNGTIWPLYHDAIQPPDYHREWWRAYDQVNRRFADVVAARLAPGGTVWVQDYQLQLLPALLREQRPDARIGVFLHIPFPPEELFARLPWRRQILQGLLGADLVGFQDSVATENFLRVVERFVEVDEILRTPTHAAVYLQDREVRVGAFPISIDAEEVARLAARPSVQRQARQIRRRLGDPRCVLLGVDRLDYTKGIDARLRAFAELLQEGRVDAAETVMVQIATPSREDVHGYSEVRRRVERLVGEINGEFAEVGRPAVHYIHRSLPLEELVALYLAADVLVVTSFQDGMNLVAKEFVASRLDRTGRLVLSEFAGAAHELPQAFLVNPHDLEGTKDAMAAAIHCPPDEARRRMAPMREQVTRHDVHHWAARFLRELERCPCPDEQAVVAT